MKLLGIVLAFACCGAGVAKADWEYTKWGMTPEQVVSASKNLAKEGSDLHPDSDGNVTKLVAPYRSGKFSFEAQFGFDAADKLSSVTLVLNDKSASMDMDMAAAMATAAREFSSAHPRCSSGTADTVGTVATAATATAVAVMAGRTPRRGDEKSSGSSNSTGLIL